MDRKKLRRHLGKSIKELGLEVTELCVVQEGDWQIQITVVKDLTDQVVMFADKDAPEVKALAQAVAKEISSVANFSKLEVIDHWLKIFLPPLFIAYPDRYDEQDNLTEKARFLTEEEKKAITNHSELMTKIFVGEEKLLKDGYYEFVGGSEHLWYCFAAKRACAIAVKLEMILPASAERA